MQLEKCFKHRLNNSRSKFELRLLIYFHCRLVVSSIQTTWILRLFVDILQSLMDISWDLCRLAFIFYLNCVKFLTQNEHFFYCYWDFIVSYCFLLFVLVRVFFKDSLWWEIENGSNFRFITRVSFCTCITWTPWKQKTMIYLQWTNSILLKTFFCRVKLIN